MQSAVLAVIDSVRLHTLQVSCQNDLSYDHGVFTEGQPHD